MGRLSLYSRPLEALTLNGECESGSVQVVAWACNSLCSEGEKKEKKVVANPMCLYVDIKEGEYASMCGQEENLWRGQEPQVFTLHSERD